MKKVLFIFVFLFAFLFQVKAQTNVVVLATTIASSTSKTFYIPLYKYMEVGVVDSVVLSVYYKGAIKDSTLALTRGFYNVAPTYNASSTVYKNNYEQSYFGTADTTITPGITNTTYTYTKAQYKWVKGYVTTGTSQKTYLDGYNHIRGVFLTKSTGNTATADTQVLMMIARIYWHKF